MPYLRERMMPLFDLAPPVPAVPFAAGSHSSFLSALTEAKGLRRGRKTRAYLLELEAAADEGLSDPEAARAIARRLAVRGVPVQSICSIRGAVADALLLEAAGLIEGDWGRLVQRWRLNAAGRAAAAVLRSSPSVNQGSQK